MKQIQRIAIVGGGLAGLATARALQVFGMRAEVYEAAPQLGEIGAAVTISPNGAKAMQGIGLAEAIASIATISHGVATRDMHSGEILDLRDYSKASQRFGAPHASFHRADLHHALATSVESDSIHLGHRLTEIGEHGSVVVLTFANGAVVEADVVIGADGVRSVVREELYGSDTPSYTGQMVWRTLLKGSDVPIEVLEPSGHTQWVGPGRHFNAYYIRGTDLVNVVTQEDTDLWVAETWSARGDPDEMRGSFAHPEPRLATLLTLVTECSKWGLFTRPLTSNWGRGQIQLIGDAAHAMLPNVGQGANQAFEDAYVLSRWLQAEPNAAEAFRNFRRVRIPRVHAVQRLAVERAQLKNMQDAAAQKAIFATGKQGKPDFREWLWGYDPVHDWDKEPKLIYGEAQRR